MSYFHVQCGFLPSLFTKAKLSMSQQGGNSRFQPLEDGHDDVLVQ